MDIFIHSKGIGMEPTTMACPTCGGATEVVDSRKLYKINSIRRRRKCLTCKNRFTTFERSPGAEDFMTKQNSSAWLDALEESMARRIEQLTGSPIAVHENFRDEARHWLRELRNRRADAEKCI